MPCTMTLALSLMNCKGDQVVNNGGLFATVLNVKDDRIVASIADGVKVELAKTAVSARVKSKKG